MLRKLSAVLAPLMLAATLGGTAFAFGDPTGGGGGGGGSGPPKAVTGTAQFFDGTVNGVDDCTGVGGTVGGSFGTASWKSSTPSTVVIHVSHIAPSATFRVIMDQPLCTELVPDLGTLVTDKNGKGVGTYTFSSTPYTGTGTFILFPRTKGAHEYQTHVITF